jgi:hypothetical protein
MTILSPFSMRKICRRLVGIAVVACLLASTPVFSQEPQSLIDRLETLRKNSAADSQSTETDELILLSLLDRQIQESAVRALDRQTPRTDQQTGTSAPRARATSLVTRPGIPDFFSLSAEHDNLGTGSRATDFTLTATPANLYYRMSGQDTPEKWDRWSPLRHLAASVTLESSSSDGQAFQNAELKYVLLGNRSARDRDFRRKFLAPLMAKAGLQEAANIDTAAQRAIAGTSAEKKLSDTQVTYKKWREQKGTLTVDDVTTKVDSLLSDLERGLTQDERATIKQAALNYLQGAATIQDFDSQFEAAAKTFTGSGWEVALAAGTSHDPDVSDFTYLDLSATYTFPQNTKYSVSFDTTAEANQSRRDPQGAALDTLHGYSAAAGFTASGYLNDRLDLSLEGELRRDEAAALDLGTLGLKAVLNLGHGFSIPVAATYSNRTVDSPKSSTEVTAGLSLDVNSLLPGGS